MQNCFLLFTALQVCQFIGAHAILQSQNCTGVAQAFKADARAEAARERKMYHYKSHYFLDRCDGIEHDALYQPLTPEEIVLGQTIREKL